MFRSVSGPAREGACELGSRSDVEEYRSCTMSPFVGRDQCESKALLKACGFASDFRQTAIMGTFLRLLNRHFSWLRERCGGDSMGDEIFSLAELRVLREAFDCLVDSCETTRDHLARLVLIAARRQGAKCARELVSQVQQILREGDLPHLGQRHPCGSTQFPSAG